MSSPRFRYKGPERYGENYFSDKFQEFASAFETSTVTISLGIGGIANKRFEFDRDGRRFEAQVFKLIDEFFIVIKEIDYEAPPEKHSA